MKSNAPSFERLEQTATMIARHAEYPGKAQVVAECLDDIEDRWEQGQLSLEQRFQLYAVLLRETSKASLGSRPSELDGACTSTTSSTGSSAGMARPRTAVAHPAIPQFRIGLAWRGAEGTDRESTARLLNMSSVGAFVLDGQYACRASDGVASPGGADADGMGRSHHRATYRVLQGRIGLLGAMPRGFRAAAQ